MKFLDVIFYLCITLSFEFRFCESFSCSRIKSRVIVNRYDKSTSRTARTTSLMSKSSNNVEIRKICTNIDGVKDGFREANRRNNAVRNVIIPVLTFLVCLFAGQHASYASSSFIDNITQKYSDSGFIQSFLLIFISEIGDKTFFIAALLAAKYGRFLAFTGSIAALAVMTVISTVLGQIFHAVPASLTQGVPFDDIVAVLAFSYFGVKTLIDAFKNDESNSGIEEEKEEAEKEVEELSAAQKRTTATALLVQIFSLVFAAEIGDRSFLSTIALSAALNPYSVAVGAIVAHASATGIAVGGGSLLSKYLSEKVIGYIGGTLFIVFAITTALGIF